jgi:hypothetical protein
VKFWLKLGFDNIRDSGDIKIIKGNMVGDIPKSFEESLEDLRLETFDVDDLAEPPSLQELFI